MSLPCTCPLTVPQKVRNVGCCGSPSTWAYCLALGSVAEFCDPCIQKGSFSAKTPSHSGKYNNHQSGCLNSRLCTTASKEASSFKLLAALKEIQTTRFVVAKSSHIAAPTCCLSSGPKRAFPATVKSGGIVFMETMITPSLATDKSYKLHVSSFRSSFDSSKICNISFILRVSLPG